MPRRMLFCLLHFGNRCNMFNMLQSGAICCNVRCYSWWFLVVPLFLSLWARRKYSRSSHLHGTSHEASCQNHATKIQKISCKLVLRCPAWFTCRQNSGETSQANKPFPTSLGCWPGNISWLCGCHTLVASPWRSVFSSSNF